jgi:hypothetical protein
MPDDRRLNAPLGGRASAVLLAVCSASFVVYVLPHSSVVRSLVKWIGGG